MSDPADDGRPRPRGGGDAGTREGDPPTGVVDRPDGGLATDGGTAAGGGSASGEGNGNASGGGSGGGSGGSDVGTELDRDIGLVGAVALGVGTMIAAGIFVLSGLAVSSVGAMAIGSFLIAAVVASFTAFAYAEFSAIYPESGGGYAYVANVFDTDLTYVVGWSMILGYPASAAFYLASFSDWFARFVYPALSIPEAAPYWVPGLAVLVLLIGVNLKGTEETGLFQIVVTALKVALILLFLVGGLRALDVGVVRQSFVENVDQFAAIGRTSALVFITFFGFEAIATNAEEIEEPGRNVPRAIFVSMGLVTVVYTLVVLVIVLAVNDGAFLTFLAENADLGGLAPEAFVARSGEVSMAYAAQYYLDQLGGVGFYIIIVGALFSMLSAANATILAGSRVKLAMSRRAHLPHRFQRLHPELNTPYQSVLFTGGLILAFVLLFTVLFGGGPGSEALVHLPLALPVVGAELHLGVDAIAHFADFMLLTGLVAVNLAIVQSRRADPDLDRPFRMPGVPIVPAIAVVANLVLLVNVEPSSFLFGLVAEVAGIALWVAVVSGPSEERIERETPTVVEERTPHERDYRVVVPVAKPANVPQLMRTARDLAAANDGEILVTSVVTLPDQTPLSEGRAFVADRREIVHRAMAYLEDEGTPGGAAPLADGAERVRGGADASGGAGTDRADGDRTDRVDGDEPVPVSGTVRIAHHAGEAIVHTVQQYDADAVVMGWTGEVSHRREVVLGSVVDEVVTEAPCDVFVERIAADGGGTVDAILLPTAGGPHAEAAADLAGAVAIANDASVDLLHVVPPDADEARRADGRDAFAATADRLPDVPTERLLVEADDRVDAIVEHSGEYDLTVVGATREGLFERLVFGDVPEAVGRRAASAVVMAKRDLGVTSRLRYRLLKR